MLDLILHVGGESQGQNSPWQRQERSQVFLRLFAWFCLVFSGVVMFRAEDKLRAQELMLSAMCAMCGKQCITWHVSNLAFQILIQKGNLNHFSLCTQGACEVCKETSKTGGVNCGVKNLISQENTGQP